MTSFVIFVLVRSGVTVLASFNESPAIYCVGEMWKRARNVSGIACSRRSGNHCCGYAPFLSFFPHPSVPSSQGRKETHERACSQRDRSGFSSDEDGSFCRRYADWGRDHVCSGIVANPDEGRQYGQAGGMWAGCVVAAFGGECYSGCIVAAQPLVKRRSLCPPPSHNLLIMSSERCILNDHTIADCLPLATSELGQILYKIPPQTRKCLL